MLLPFPPTRMSTPDLLRSAHSHLSLFKFITLTRSFHGPGALRAKHKSFRPAGYYPDVRLPTENAFVDSCPADISSIITLMYPSPISSILVSIHRCPDLLVLTTPVPLSLTLVAPVIASPVPPNPIGNSLAYATPIPLYPIVNSRSPSQYSFTFATFQIHHANPFFPWARRSSRKTQVFSSRWQLS